MAEATVLADAGVKELILVAQETTLYGMDLYGEKSLPKLLRKLAEIPGIFWIRILYCYPEEITDELIQVMKEQKNLKQSSSPIADASGAVVQLPQLFSAAKDTVTESSGSMANTSKPFLHLSISE